MNIEGIFPTPIGMSKFDRALTPDEMSFITNQEKKQTTKDTNQVSRDTEILNRQELKGVRNFIQKELDEYLQRVYSPMNDVKLRITQSWCNYIDKDQCHPRHTHSNSIVSGVFYPKVSDGDKIYFATSKYEQIFVAPKESHLYNSTMWYFDVKIGQLILFPSSLPHMVGYVTSDDTRISLAFNTFLSGKLIDGELLSELTL
jgi:uncharacterized protein (TIGR02466 family)